MKVSKEVILKLLIFVLVVQVNKIDEDFED
jgi:hypothetical protein